jgi:hypothetical protein
MPLKEFMGVVTHDGRGSFSFFIRKFKKNIANYVLV